MNKKLDPQLLIFAKSMHHSATDAEQVMWQILGTKRFMNLKFRRYYARRVRFIIVNLLLYQPKVWLFLINLFRFCTVIFLIKNIINRIGERGIKLEYKLEGNWRAGWALDLHTISSVKNANGGFDNTYTEIGYALNQLKYHHSIEQLNYLGSRLVAFMNTRMVTPYLDVIVPVPPSNQREVQPVYEIASLLAQGIRVC